MTASQSYWRKLIRGLTLIDMVVSVVCTIFGAYSLLYIKLVYLVAKTETDTSVSSSNYTHDVGNLKTGETMDYDGRASNHSKVNVIWAIFTAIFAYFFVLVVQLWISVKLFKLTSLVNTNQEENSVTLSKSRFWRNFSLFHVGCCVLFICLESIWTPEDPMLKILLICFILYRLVCFVLTYTFIKEISALAAEQEEVVISVYAESNKVSEDNPEAPNSRGHVH